MTDLDAQIAEDYAITSNKAETARNLGLSTSMVKRRLEKQGVARPVGSESISITGTTDSQVLESVSPTIRTVEDALREAKIDQTQWKVARAVINKWDATMKLHAGQSIANGKDGVSHVVRNADKVLPAENWQVKIWLERIIPKGIEDVLERIGAFVSKCSRKSVQFARKPPTSPHMLEISIFDAHLGKLCWDEETGNNYDLKIAQRIYLNAFQDLLRKTSGYNIDKISLPIGQDLFQIDNAKGTTFAGTLVDRDGRYSQIFAAACSSLILGIDAATKIADVEVQFVPGNHDPTISWHLCMYLKAWYRDNPHVIVDVSPKQRKYIHYGINLIGLTHGNEESPRDMPGVMASEVPAEWAASHCREIHSGHFHKKKEIQFVSTDSFGPLVSRTLPSISATDAWHYMKGYVGGQRAAEAYLYSKEDGYTGHFSSRVKC